ncbi:MAG: Maf family nucleotide pyrophosphatase [Salibacteraceae bacterium]
MYSNLKKYQVVLASNSPRRKELLGALGIDFKVQSSLGEETYPNELDCDKVAEFLAVQKANWFDDFTANQLYITADTIVLLDNKVLGKPSNSEEAKQTLASLSNKTHQVITAFCIKSKNKLISKSVVTEVTFSTLSESQIDYYIELYKPFDKAGSYGIQEWIGMIGIEKINGSYFNVVGLPTHELFHELSSF